VALVCDSDIVKIAYLLMMGAGRFVQMLAMAKIAPQSFADIARPGALEILQTTPITLSEIVRAAYAFLLHHFRRGVLPMLALDALVLLMIALGKSTADSAWGFAGALLAQNCLFLSGLCAMGVTGMWLGLKQRSLARASFSTFFYFLLLPASLYVLRPTSPARDTAQITRWSDGVDRINARSLFTYGMATRLLGRSAPENMITATSASQPRRRCHKSICM
jgi:hypothetical protein